MFSSPKSKISEKSNTELAMVIYTLMFSPEGTIIFKNSMRESSKVFTERIKTFSNSLKKSQYFQSLKDPEKVEKEYTEKFNKFLELLKDIPESEINQIKQFVDKNFIKDQNLVLEGLILGILRWIKTYFGFYYELIKFQERTISNNKITEVLMKELDNETWAFPEGIIARFEMKNYANAKNLKIIPKESSSTEYDQLEQANKQIVKVFLIEKLEKGDIDLILKSLCTNDEKCVKKFQNNIASEYKKEADTIKEGITSFEGEIYNIIQDTIYQLLMMRNKLLTKELYQAISKTF